MEKKRGGRAKERGEGGACRFKVDESYRRKPIGRASISSNSATDPYPLFSHQRQHLSTNSNVSCASTLLARACVYARAYTGEISALVCAQYGRERVQRAEPAFT